jgi:hypothetical protein
MSFKHTLLSLVLVISIATAGFAGYRATLPTPANAQAGLLPFGGWIVNVVWCSCSMGILLTVSPPVPGTYVFQFGRSIPFAMGQVFRPGPAVLGTWTPGGVCAVFVGFGCAPIPAMGTIGIIGTSL